MDTKKVITAALTAAAVVGGGGFAALKFGKPPPDSPYAYRVYAVERAGVLVPTVALDDGGTMELKEFPCAMRPAGSPAGSCARADGSDPGDENVMQPGRWRGGGCVRTACVIVAGHAPP